LDSVLEPSYLFPESMQLQKTVCIFVCICTKGGW
jgi:hypothetical protein